MNILLILALGLVLRLISLNQSFWLDEATSATVARMDWPAIFEFIKGDFHPPLYYLSLKFWVSLFGQTEIATRAFSVIAGIATIFVVYKIGLKINKKLAGVASLFLATAPLHIYYSQEARMYSLLTLFVSLCFYFYINKKFLWFSITIALAFFTDYLAVLFFPVFLLYPIITKNKNQFYKTVLAFAPLALISVFWIPSLMTQLSSGVDVKNTAPLWWSILGGASIKQVVLLSIKFLIGRVSFDNNLLYLLSFLPALLISTFALFKARKQNLFFWAWLIVPIVLALSVSFFVPIFTYFRLIFVIPAFYLLIGCGIKNFRTLVAALIISNIIFSSAYLFTPKFHREDWRGLVEFISQKSKHVQPVYFVANSQMEAFNYYAQNTNLTAKPANEIVFQSDKLWIMRYVHDIFDPQDNLVRLVEQNGYTEFVEYNFNGVVVREYKK